MNFLFVDRIFELEPLKWAKGIKHVVASDPYLKKDSKGRSILSSCIIGEALGQLTAWVVMQANNFLSRPVAGIVDEVQIYREVHVGETIYLNTQIEEMNDQSVLYNSYATVCNEKVFSLTHAVGPLLPMEDFIDTKVAREQFKMIDRRGSLSTHLNAGVLEKSNNSLKTSEAINLSEVSFFDEILSMGPDSITAQKKISLLAPYFLDHFPRKPVLPLTLLLEGKLELASFFLQKTQGKTDAYTFRPLKLQKIRMKQFVMPGDCIITTLSLKERIGQRFLLSFKTQIDERVICSLEAVFEENSLENIKKRDVEVEADTKLI